MKKLSLTLTCSLISIINLFAQYSTPGNFSDESAIVVSGDQKTTAYIQKNSAGSVGEITDIVGNKYKTIVIGTQTWMAENLKTSKYNDGGVIPNVEDQKLWATLSTPAYCWFNNDSSKFKDVYGAIYNWYTVENGKLCPLHWHVPTNEDWKILIKYLGGEMVAGGKLKEAGTNHWESPNTGATNETGFTALPVPNRTSEFFGDYKFVGGWWSSTSSTSCFSGIPKCGYAWFMHYDRSTFVNSTSMPLNGLSVRCLKD